ncbi:metallophosphoesterase family protein [Luteibaculum oceani]|uniref:Phosphoesterase n=1 Tax=Luteibaculum oceani TaxID=1294296 RepID=A0A5C6V9C8_9FLAO|nr:metallophosphoesterase family protein [Luteibaculum oceani]TXC81320.1 metallophosphoesterase family protein [Luteibaculum oceani]
MQIAIISDTHSYLDNKIWKYLNEVDEIWHAGDVGAKTVIDQLEKLGKPLRGVYGNIDNHEIRKIFPEFQYFDIQGLRIGMTHIAGNPGRYPSKIKDWFKQHPCDLFICGHSHILKVTRDKEFGHLHMNPGAAGRHGFHQTKTILLLDINNGKPENLRVVELGPRAKI